MPIMNSIGSKTVNIVATVGLFHFVVFVTAGFAMYSIAIGVKMATSRKPTTIMMMTEAVIAPLLFRLSLLNTALCSFSSWNVSDCDTNDH